MSTPFDLSKPDRPIHVGVVLMGGETEILDVAPVDFFNGLTKDFFQDWPEEWLDPKLREQALDFKFHWVNETGNLAKLTGGTTVQPTDKFSTAPPLDIVLMGAHSAGYKPNETELEYVRKAYENSSAFITVCGGIQAALEAGVLKGKSATCPRFLLPHARQIAPDTKWEDKRWHRDGKLWTSGALLNGLDLIRAFGQEMWGGEGSLVEHWLEMGHFPIRNTDYRDAPSER